MKIRKNELLCSLPPEWREDLLPAIRALVEQSRTKIVVLDDDPTGTQTVFNVPVLTEWSMGSLETVLNEPDAIVYILTNSRSLPLAQAQMMNREIAINLRAASRATGRDFVVISRSDSTLRGHYPGEVLALVEGLGARFDGTLIVPFFFEGGRLTIEDYHYVAEGDWLVPAAETEYAADATFGYRNSNLRAWVGEKFRGQIQSQDVASIGLADLRLGGPEVVAAKLDQVVGGKVCVVNSTSYRDMEVFVMGLLQAEGHGKRFIYRTGASFVRVRGGLASPSLLTSADLGASERKNGGVVIAGSYIKKSTVQIEATESLPGITSLELGVDQLLDPLSHQRELDRVATAMNQALIDGKDVVVFTSRRLATGSDEVSTLKIGQSISDALIEIVHSLTVRPRWMIAKGGITSADIATKGLGVKRAQVLGQAIPGVPIWRTGAESRWPGMVYVVFPGNVGGPNAIVDMIQILRGEARR